jgi:hypothetical protein
MKRNKVDDFGDILAALNRQAAGEERADSAPQAELHAQVESIEEPPRRKNPIRRLFENISFPWPSDISSVLNGFSWRPQKAYAEHMAEAASRPVIEPRGGAAAKDSKVNRTRAAKTENEAIADELGLNPALGMIDLKRIRRDFAKKNHPDRFEPARRSSAERRMSIANMLIDEQMRQSRGAR